jgi:hypothetical protein
VIEQIHPFKRSKQTCLSLFLMGAYGHRQPNQYPFSWARIFFFLENGCFENEFRKLHKSFLNYLEKKYFLTHVK